MLSVQALPWSEVLNFIIYNYFVDSFATCILWHKTVNFDLHQLPLSGPVQFVQISRANLNESLQEDIYDFRAKLLEKKFEEPSKSVDNEFELVFKLSIAIEQTNCENFIAFQEDIPIFAKAFRLANHLSVWRSQQTKFLFAYRKDLQDGDYFDDPLFEEQPNILVLEATLANSTQLLLKTNKFVGSLNDNPSEMYLLCSCDVMEETVFSIPCLRNLYPDKTSNLQGREIIVAGFDYRPYVVIDFEKHPQIYDHAENNPNHYVFLDGTEIRPLFTFCEMYNCTVQVHTIDELDWGEMFENGTGTGLFGMISSGRAHYIVSGLYLWYLDYVYLDLSYITGRAGVTLMVPKPPRLTSWNLPIKPFHISLWLGIIGCLLLELLSLSVVRQMVPDQIANPTWSDSFRFGFVVILKLFVSQGHRYQVTRTSMRLLLISCYIIGIIVCSVYSGGLAAILTTPIHEEAADSMWRLYTHKLLWSASSEAWIISLQDVSDDAVIQSIVEQFRVNSWPDMSKLALTEQMGFAVERLTFGHFADAEFLTDTALDRLKLMIDDIYSAYTVAYVPRLWPLLGRFNMLIHAWHAGGLNKICEWKVVADHMNIQRQDQIELSKFLHTTIGPVKLDLVNFSGLIIVWVVGVLSSVLVFVAEMIVSRIARKKKSP